MTELPVIFGSGGRLVGTLTLPAENTSKKVALLLCNAGVIHRIGPHRINVKLARSVAAQGVAVFRFDLSGQGDSGASTQSASFEDQAVLDIRAAMDCVQRTTGVKAFAMAGICSGAHHSLAAALLDPRLVALWMLDGYTYSTRTTTLVRIQWQLRHRPVATLIGWAMRPASMLSRRMARSILAAQDDAASLNDGSHPTPPKQAFAGMIQALVDRGVKLRLAYSGNQIWRYNYPDQFRDAFAGHGFINKLRCDYLPEVDHTVTSLNAQRQVTASITDWIRSLDSISETTKQPAMAG